MHSRKFVAICSKKYFTRFMCMFEIINFLQQPGGEGDMLVMSEEMAWLFFVFYLNNHILAIGFYAFAAFGDSEGKKSLTAATCVGAACLGLAFGLLPYLFSLGMALHRSAQQIPSQIRRFRIESATCICCDLQHQHPLSGMPLMCDKDQVLHGMAEESFSGAKMLTGFNAMVRERAPTLERLASITVSQPMLELLSTCVLPSLPRYL